MLNPNITENAWILPQIAKCLKSGYRIKMYGDSLSQDFLNIFSSA